VRNLKRRHILERWVSCFGIPIKVGWFDDTGAELSGDRVTKSELDRLSLRALFGDSSNRDAHEYVATEACEVPAIHGLSHFADNDKVTAKPLRLKVHIEVFESLDTEFTQSTTRGKNASGGSRSTVSARFDDPRLVSIFNTGLVFLYLAFALVVLVLGPAALVTTVFKLWLVLKVSASAVARLNHLHPYVGNVAAPLEYVDDLVTQHVAAMIGKIIQALVQMLMEALRGVANDTEMGVKYGH
jgi:hypothetical protein